ncbi:PAS domain-containing sensor histidine kinase [Sesbania bispinosa]|nr:PAS domain-containing sensor histidine kinase [Sesbania bispinosa]
MAYLKRLFLIIYRAITTRNRVQRRLLESPIQIQGILLCSLKACGLTYLWYPSSHVTVKKNEGEQKGSNAGLCHLSWRV